MSRGYHHFKLKLGTRGSFDHDLSAVAWVAEHLTSKGSLRLDANGCLPAERLQAQLEELARFPIAFIEEPSAPEATLALAAPPVPIAFDESLRSEHAPAIAEFVARHPGSVLVLKPMALGGIEAVVDWVQHHPRGPSGVTLTHLFDGPIGLDATRTLANALGVGYPAGTAPHPFVVAEAPWSSARASDEAGDAIALELCDQRLTFSELARAVSDVQKLVAPIRKAPGPPELVAFPVDRELSSLKLVYACLELGLPFLPLHPRFTLAERYDVLRRFGVAWTLRPSALAPHGFELDALAPSAPKALPTDTAVVVLTSGTTGSPKGVCLSHSALVEAADANWDHLGSQDADRWLLNLPPAHVGGLSILLRCLRARRTVVIAANDCRSGAALFETLASKHITLVSLVPTLLERLVSLGKRAPTSLRAVLLGGAAAPASLVRKARALGYPVLLSYGLSETSAQFATQAATTSTATAAEDPPSATAVGYPLGRGRVRLDATGRIEVETPALFSGYLGEAERKAGEWFETSDLGRFDELGRLEVLGRLDDVIITGGENVAPEAIESALARYPGISRACAFGVPDEKFGELIAVALVPSADFDLMAFAAFCKTEFANFRRPRRYALVPHLFDAQTGKVSRFRVREQVAAELSPLPQAG
jgi:O-succinylbenzoic acid--CoA ligase